MASEQAQSGSGQLAGKVVWVVGASGALGSAIAVAAAQAGASVIASGRRAEALKAVVDEITAAGGQAQARVLDVGDAAAVAQTARDIEQSHGRVDGLVNSTALSIFGDFVELTDEQWWQVLDAKLIGYIRTMRAVLGGMAARGSGAIVNISGRGGKQPTPAHLPGGCANAAVNLMSKGVADAYVARGVRVNVVAPGPIASERFSKIKASNEKVAGGPVPRAGLDRLGTPEDVANAVVWLLSPLSGHTTGAVVPVDGGGTATV